MSDVDLTEAPAETTTRCTQCDGPLPALLDQLAVVYGAEGEPLVTCSTACLAGLVVALAGRTEEPATGRRN